jgi:hypothetical protein
MCHSLGHLVTKPATSHHNGTAVPRTGVTNRWSSRFLAAATFASLLMVDLSANASAQSANAMQLQAESNALDAQMRSLEKKMHRLEIQPTPVAAAGYKNPAVSDEPSFFADKKLHLGGVTITPGGFIEAAGLSHQRNP